MQSTELIAPLAIQTPFAINGDKNIPSQNAQGTDTSSINLGFLPITSEPLDDGGRAPERIDFNGMFYLATDQRVFLQNGGFITYNANVSTAIGGYPKGAVLAYLDNLGNFNFVESEIENNQYNFITNPEYINGTYWSYRNVLKDLSNISSSITSIPPSSLTNFDGQWVSSYHTLSTATSSGLFSASLSTYLPNDNYNYLCQFSVNIYDYGDTNGKMYFETDIYQVNNAFVQTQLHVNQGNENARHNSNVFTMPIGTGRYVRWYCTDANTTREFALVGYRRLGTNS